VRIGIQQRALPHYRAPLYDAIAKRCPDPVEVFAGYPEASEGVRRAEALNHAEWRFSRNRCLAVGRQKAYWQPDFVGWMESFRPEVLLVESNPRILSNYGGFRRARKRGICVIGWGVGVMGNSKDEGPYGWIMRRYFRQFDGMIAYGTKGAEDFRRLGVDEDRVFIARNSVSSRDIDKLLDDPAEAEVLVREFREWHQISGQQVILFLGRMVPEKRVDLLFNAVKRVSMNCHILMVGDGPCRETLEREAKKDGIHATFVGHLTGRDLAVAIRSSDICVLPGQGGLAIQEAMTAGVPVISGVADGTQVDLVEHGVTGFRFLGDNIASLSNLIVESLSRPDLIAKMGAAARQLVNREHNLDLAVDAVFSAIKSIMSR